MYYFIIYCYEKKVMIMKKMMLLTLIPMVLCGCKKDKYKDLSFIVPTGAPAVAMSAFSGLKGFETTTDPSTIVPLLAKGQYDVAVLPTNVGVTAINVKKVPYKLLCTVTFGNLYIASTGKDSDGVMGADDYIVSFQQGAVPDKIFHYVYGNELDSALHYVSGAADAAKCLKSGKNAADDSKDVDYVLLAEPALTKVLETTPTASIYANLQEKYSAKSEGLILTQASVFVKDTLDEDTVKSAIYKTIESSVNQMIKRPEKIKSNLEKVDDPTTLFGIEAEYAVKTTQDGNKMGIGCKLASEIKDDVNKFLTIFGVDPIADENIA